MWLVFSTKTLIVLGSQFAALYWLIRHRFEVWNRLRRLPHLWISGTNASREEFPPVGVSTLAMILFQVPPALLYVWVQLPHVRTRQELEIYVIGPLVLAPILVAIYSAFLIYARSQFTQQGVLALSPRRFFSRPHRLARAGHH